MVSDLRINGKRTSRRIHYQLTRPTGITVIDISDLGHVRYCFIRTPATRAPPGREGVYRLTPLSAWDYLKAYHDIKSEEPEAYASVLRPFKGADVVTTDALQETWPDAKCFYNSSQIQSTGTVSTSLEGTVIKALRDVALDSFLAYLLDPSEDDPSLLAQAEDLPDFSLQLKRKLLAEAQSLQPSRFVLHLLFKAFEREAEVDLSRFITIRAKDLGTLVSELQEKGNMTVLNLSNRPDISEADLRTILCMRRHSALKALVLLENTQISLPFVCAHLSNYDVYHSELLRQPLLVHSLGNFRYESYKTPLEITHSKNVSQLICIAICGEAALDPKRRLADGRIDWNPLEYHGYSGCSHLRFSKYPLDVPMPVGTFVHSLSQLLKWISAEISYLLYREKSFSEAVAFCFASASPRAQGTGYGVGPLSAALRREHHCVKYKAKLSLNEGQWAAILVHEAYDIKNQAELDKYQGWDTKGNANAADQSPPITGNQHFRALKRLRYALVSPVVGSSPPKYTIVDMATYLDLVMQDGGESGIAEAKKWSDQWNESTANLAQPNGPRMDQTCQFDFYGDDDINDILQKVYPAKEPEDAPQDEPEDEPEDELEDGPSAEESVKEGSSGEDES